MASCVINVSWPSTLSLPTTPKLPHPTSTSRNDRLFTPILIFSLLLYIPFIKQKRAFNVTADEVVAFDTITDAAEESGCQIHGLEVKLFPPRNCSKIGLA